jgi:hypothetical protein
MPSKSRRILMSVIVSASEHAPVTDRMVHLYRWIATCFGELFFHGYSSTLQPQMPVITP